MFNSCLIVIKPILYSHHFGTGDFVAQTSSGGIKNVFVHKKTPWDYGWGILFKSHFKIVFVQGQSFVVSRENVWWVTHYLWEATAR